MRYLLAIFFIVTLIACNSKKQMKANGYFEGTVEYNSSYAGVDTSMTSMLKKAFGVRIISYVSEKGYVRREYIDTNNIIISTEIYRPDSLKVFYIANNADTILCRNITVNTNSKIVKKEKNRKEKILGHTVDLVEVRDDMKSTATGKPFIIYSIYYNDTNYLLCPSAYRNVKSSLVENIFSFSPHLTTKYFFQYGEGATITSTASRIIPSTIPVWRFDIPKNKKIVQQN